MLSGEVPASSKVRPLDWEGQRVERLTAPAARSAEHVLTIKELQNDHND